MAAHAVTARFGAGLTAGYGYSLYQQGAGIYDNYDQLSGPERVCQIGLLVGPNVGGLLGGAGAFRTAAVQKSYRAGMLAGSIQRGISGYSTSVTAAQGAIAYRAAHATAIARGMRVAPVRGVAKTPVSQGAGRAAKQGTPNSIYEQVDGAGNVRSRTFYDENGRSFSRQDFDHPHGGMQPHEHLRDFDSRGRPISKETVRQVPNGYDNSPSN